MGVIKENELDYDSEDYDYDDNWDDDNWDICYECGGYGDDYFVNEEGELECACDYCPFNELNWHKDPWDD